MKTLAVIEVGAATGVTVEAANDYHAVAEVADCAVNDVAIPIWERQVHPWQPRGARCYMPLDGSGRQWIVTDAEG